jgi:phospholipid-binding lipoprotein MlaA
MRLGAYLKVWGVLVALVALQGCATVSQPDARDPLESVNRSIYGFNDAVDNAVLKPVAKGYVAVTPNWLRKGVGNFFNNLEDMWSVVNNALQGRGQAFSDSLGRVMVNTSIGMLGTLDVASELEIERRTADFGQTLGKWGVPPGPYVVLPLLGPRTLREVAAMPVDVKGQPLYNIGDQETRAVLPVVNVIDLRAKYLNAGDLLQGAALDVYSFQRDAYFQRQRNIQYDGEPPEEDPQPDTPPDTQP